MWPEVCTQSRVRVAAATWLLGCGLVLGTGVGSTAEAAVTLKSNGVSTKQYGKNFGTNQNPTALKATFIGTGNDVLLHAQSYDIDTDGEVVITLNGSVIGNLPVTENKKLSRGTLWLLPAGKTKVGKNILKFTKTGGDVRWGVTRLGIFAPGSSKTAFGYLKKIGGDTRHRKSIRLYVPRDVDDTQIGVRFFDVDESNEVAISLAGSTTESPAVTANNKWGATTYHIVPGDGGWIEFSNTLVDDDPMTWGVQFTHTGRALRANQVGGFSTVSDSAWDEAAVRRVLHTFAWGGHPKEVTIRRWANLPPRVAITQMLNFQHHNLLLSAPHAKDNEGLSKQPNTLKSLRAYMTRSNKVPWSEKFLYRDDWAIGLSVASLGSMRGLNPFRTRIGVWETNYHMATNLNAGVEPHQMVRYYDDILSSLEKNEPYQNTLAAAASTAAIAKQYAHNESRYYADEDFCECNEDFAREYYQLFFGILGQYDPEHHETVTIKNMSRVLTDIRVSWTNSLQGEPTVPQYGREYHFRGDLPLLPGTVSVDRANARSRLRDISDIAINHAESLDNLPVKIISGLADDNMDDAKASVIRTAWASMSEKNLLDFLRAYAISDTFHNATRVKYWNSFDRTMIFNNGYYFTNREVIISSWLINRYDREGFNVFEPQHNVFGGQRGTEAARSTNVFRSVYNGSTQDLWRFGRIREYTGGFMWEKDWGSVIPKVSGSHTVKNVAEYLWNRFIGDGLKNFGAVERAHVYALLGSRFDLMQGLDGDRLNRVIDQNDMQTDGAVVQYVTKMSRQKLPLTSASRATRDTANVLVGRAVAFIVATPFALAQEGL